MDTSRTAARQPQRTRPRRNARTRSHDRTGGAGDRHAEPNLTQGAIGPTTGWAAESRVSTGTTSDLAGRLNYCPYMYLVREDPRNIRIPLSHQS